MKKIKNKMTGLVLEVADNQVASEEIWDIIIEKTIEVPGYSMAELKAAADAEGIEYKGNISKKKLKELLEDN